MPYTINTYINSPDNTRRFVLGYDNSNPLIVIGGLVVSLHNESP